MVAGANSQTVISYDPIQHRHWRLRHDQNANTINFETSTDGGIWTTRKTVTPGFWLTGLRFYLWAGAWGTGNASPGMAKYDNFKLLASTQGSSSLPIPNFGFESPAVGANNFQYAPTGGSWTFAGGAGITGNNSGFTGGVAAPEGSQAAFLQGGSTSSISQSVTGFQAGTNYIITFASVQRINCCNSGGQDFQVYLDSNLLGTFHPNTSGYFDYSTSTFTTTAGTHVVKFVGLNSLGGDHTAFIDNVRIQGSAVPGFGIEWLVNDQLGTPRMVFDKTGALANVKRHDYLPFGEELTASQGLRTALPGNTALGYNTPDGLRQKFVSKERDIETGLDYFSARYYGSTQGRFTSVDPYNIVREAQITGQSNPEKAASQLARYLSLPQQWNRYAYAANNPLKYADPSGQLIELTGDTEDERNAALERLKTLVGKEGGKHLGVRSEKGKDGKTHYYVTSDVNLCDVSGPKDSAKLNFYMSELIDRKDHTVEYKIADSFTTKSGTVMTAGNQCGGACTVGAEESVTGNTQIFVNKKSDTLASAALHTPLNIDNFTGPGFYVTEDMVDAHEFGHAYANAIEGKKLYFSNETYDRAVEWENLQRGTYTYPERRIREKHE